MCSVPTLRAADIPIIRAPTIITALTGRVFTAATTTADITITATTTLTGITLDFMDGLITRGPVRLPGAWAPGAGEERRGGDITRVGGILIPCTLRRPSGLRII